jgi:nitronate monooxygenase
MLRPSMLAQGLDPAEFGTGTPRFAMDRLSGNGAVGPRRYRDIWSAGHSVSGVRDVPAVADLVNRLAAEYARARAASAE